MEAAVVRIEREIVGNGGFDCWKGTMVSKEVMRNTSNRIGHEDDDEDCRWEIKKYLVV